MIYLEVLDFTYSEFKQSTVHQSPPAKTAVSVNSIQIEISIFSDTTLKMYSSTLKLNLVFNNRHNVEALYWWISLSGLPQDLAAAIGAGSDNKPSFREYTLAFRGQGRNGQYRASLTGQYEELRGMSSPPTQDCFIRGALS